MIVDLQYCQKVIVMSFAEKLKVIQNTLYDDPQKCIQLISSRIFISSLFEQELRAFAHTIEQAISKKGVHLKGFSEAKNQLRPQVVLAFYSVVIMRTNSVTMRHSTIASIATKSDQIDNPIYNSKLAIDWLSKIYRSLEEGDNTKNIITGLFLKVKGFNNYKMVVRDLDPRYISTQTLGIHFEGFKNQCPNLFQNQIVKYKHIWGSYLKFKPITLASFEQLINQANEIETEDSSAKWDHNMQQMQKEFDYLLNRFKTLEDSQQTEKLNIEEFTVRLESIYSKITQKLKQFSISKKNNKDANPQYDYRQFLLCNYIKIMNFHLTILNQSIISLHINWLRKIKWLYNFIVSLFVNFSIKLTVFHSSIAEQYGKTMKILLQILVNYLVIFKNGLFPIGKLGQFAFGEEFSIYKLVQAILYNQYPFNQSDAIVFQNYQKQRKPATDNRQKQQVIDIVNFSMRSLNINPHWDIILVKLIPNLRNSQYFARNLLSISLLFFKKFFQMTQNFEHAAKLLLMLANSKNGFLVDKNIRRSIQQIKKMIYPNRDATKQGIQYFCQEYFNEYKKIVYKQQQHLSKNNLKFFIEENKNNLQQQPKSKTIKKTESREAIIQGWQEHYESVKESSIEDIRQSGSKNQINQSVEVLNNQVFYSVKQPTREIGNIQNNNNEDDAVLVPEF